jgi:hypothetical protein
MLKYPKSNNLFLGILYERGGLYSFGAGIGMMFILDELVSDGYNCVVISHNYNVLYEPSPESSQIS